MPFIFFFFLNLKQNDKACAYKFSTYFMLNFIQNTIYIVRFFLRSLNSTIEKSLYEIFHKKQIQYLKFYDFALKI